MSRVYQFVCSLRNHGIMNKVYSHCPKDIKGGLTLTSVAMTMVTWNIVSRIGMMSLLYM